MLIPICAWLVKLFLPSPINTRLRLQKSMDTKDELFKQTCRERCQKLGRSTHGGELRLRDQGQGWSLGSKLSNLVYCEQSHQTITRRRWQHSLDKPGFTVSKSHFLSKQDLFLPQTTEVVATVSTYIHVFYIFGIITYIVL